MHQLRFHSRDLCTPALSGLCCIVLFTCSANSADSNADHRTSYARGLTPVASAGYADPAEFALPADGLTREAAEAAAARLWDERREQILEQWREPFEQKRFKLGEMEMRFEYRTFGERPEHGHSLYLSMHGGGNTRPEVNDRQWRNQIRLYEPDEGIYLAPRAPTDTWNLWHQSHIDPLFDRLIATLVALEKVDPDRVYLMGYSAGGDGVYQLAPRMADRFAAAAMMAGHPNETQPWGLRNLPFTLHMGGEDSAYNRNEVAEKWKEQLAQLRAEDPDGYDHWVEIYPGKGHWMDGEDAAAIPWMAKRTRNPWPSRVVWHQDDVTHQRLYWLAVEDDQRLPRSTITAEVQGQSITIQSDEVRRVDLLLHDRLLDLDQPIELVLNGHRQTVQVQRTLAAMEYSLDLRQDPQMIATAHLAGLELPLPDKDDSQDVDTGTDVGKGDGRQED